MTRSRSRSLTVVAGCVSLIASSAASKAQGLTVFDPLNYQQNLLTAARALESIQNQVRQLQNQAQQLLRMDLHLQPLSGSIGSELQSTLGQLSARRGEGDALALKVRETEAAYAQLYPKTFATTLSSDDLVRAAKTRWDEAYATFRRSAVLQGQVSETFDGDTRLLGQALARSQASVGALQAAQAGNELTALSVKQALQLQVLLATQHRADTADRLRGVVAEEEARHAEDIGADADDDGEHHQLDAGGDEHARRPDATRREPHRNDRRRARAAGAVLRDPSQTS